MARFRVEPVDFLSARGIIARLRVKFFVRKFLTDRRIAVVGKKYNVASQRILAAEFGLRIDRSDRSTGVLSRVVKPHVGTTTGSYERFVASMNSFFETPSDKTIN